MSGSCLLSSTHFNKATNEGDMIAVLVNVTRAQIPHPPYSPLLQFDTGNVKSAFPPPHMPGSTTVVPCHRRQTRTNMTHSTSCRSTDIPTRSPCIRFPRTHSLLLRTELCLSVPQNLGRCHILLRSCLHALRSLAHSTIVRHATSRARSLRAGTFTPSRHGCRRRNIEYW